MTSTLVDTPHGPARAELHCAAEGRAALLLGHGVHVALVEQPYRVAGRRAPAPAQQLDTAWLAVAEDLGVRWFDGLPLVFGGRSSGARVACRTSSDGQAVAVLCLAFPVHPPGKPEKTRQPELAAVEVPTLIVQGRADPFGRPESAHHREVVLLKGDHSLKADVEGLHRTVTDWLSRILRPLEV